MVGVGCDDSSVVVEKSDVVVWWIEGDVEVF